MKKLQDILSKKKIKGSDFDGVITAGIIPEKGTIILTGRPKEDEEFVREHLEHNNEIYFFPDQDKIDGKLSKDKLVGTWKGEMIKKLGITSFIDDTEKQLEIIQKINPNIELLHVKQEDPVIENVKQSLKPSSEVTACVIDYGTFICLAEKLGETFKKVYYYTPTSKEYYSIEDSVKATGLKTVERVEDIFEPKFIEKIDLFIFPDIGYEGLQKHLKSLGKAVWGNMGADELELFRDHFLNVLKELGLPTIHSEKIVGLDKLREYLKTVKNKYIKVNKYRGNMETFHHIDSDHSDPELDRLDIQFGGLSNEIVFIVQDHIDTDVETGADLWCIDGKFPSKCSQGYEKKNELYLASLIDYDKLPEVVKVVNEKLAPLLKKFNYRNFMATEIRVKDGVPYFIDPTMRMPGQSGEQLLETCTNLADVIWNGANGEVIDPEFKYKFSAAATMHYTAGGEWSVLKVPEKIRKWVKLYHYCERDGLCHFPPKSNDELGVVLGVSNTIDGAIDRLKEHLKEMKGESIDCNLQGFVELLKDIEEAEDHGIKFSNKKVPDPKSVV